jgi:ATP-dependent RNA helicase A
LICCLFQTTIKIDHSFVQALIKYISELGIPGAILVFLPGWNVIFALARHLAQNPVIGEY